VARLGPSQNLRDLRDWELKLAYTFFECLTSLERAPLEHDAKANRGSAGNISVQRGDVG
jgi:hypothetical protein